MQVPVRLSQESLFGFLTSTRLPVVSSLSAATRWIALGLGAACAVFGLYCLLALDGGFWSAAVPWSGALPSLVAAPLLFASAWLWRKRRYEAGAVLLFVAMFALTILANWPRGVFSPAWYLNPFLALLACMSLGVLPGLALTMAGVLGLLLAARQHVVDPAGATLADTWVHATSLSALTLASALSGAIVNRLIFMALLTAESQRRKNFETSRALRHREKLLRHAMRVETVGDLAGMVCHQLRNTFQVLLGHVTLGEIADDEERRRRLGLIEETLEQTRPLLDQLMSLAHPDEGAVQTTEIASLLRDFHAQAKLVLPSSIDLSLDAPESLPPVLLNPRGLTHALWNLVINAKQAIRAEGSIVLRSGSDRHQVWIEVADSGDGIPKEVRERIFDPYFTTKPVGQGTGLGLTAVARFVRGSSGLVQVDSVPGNGTTFRLRFPQSVAAVPDSIRSA
ncbi:MAG: hypothetical protein H6838_02620 [Planctomycetes bacterium]|nr:hypothetical protein [Planctomycetota bacterium]